MTTQVVSKDGEKLTLFFTQRSPFSNFHPAPFELKSTYDPETRKFLCVEHFYMYNKALACGDNASADLVLHETAPGKMKAIGRALKNFDKDLWDKACQEVMKQALHAKFVAHENLRRQLFLTHGSRLCEASPSDKMWGIGLAMDDARAREPSLWQGKNLLGKLMDDVRDQLWEREDYANEVAAAKERLAKDPLANLFDPPPPPKDAWLDRLSPFSSFDVEQQGKRRRSGQTAHRSPSRSRSRSPRAKRRRRHSSRPRSSSRSRSPSRRRLTWERSSGERREYERRMQKEERKKAIRRREVIPEPKDEEERLRRKNRHISFDLDKASPEKLAQSEVKMTEQTVSSKNGGGTCEKPKAESESRERSNLEEGVRERKDAKVSNDARRGAAIASEEGHDDGYR